MFMFQRHNQCKSIYLSSYLCTTKPSLDHRQSPRQGIKMAERNCVGCESITKNVCLKCDIFACNSSLKCLVPASETYPGWKECTKVALCFKCDKEEHATDFQQQDSSEEKENEEVAGTSDDVELYIYNIFSHSLTYL